MAARDDGFDMILAELRKTKETADGIAHGTSPKGGADDVRVVAGLVHQVAEQVERLGELLRRGSPAATGHTSPEEVPRPSS